MEGALEALVAFVIAVGPMAITVTKIVDTIRNAFDSGGSAPPVVWNLTAFAVGVGVALLWQFNFVIPLLQAVPALANHTSNLEGIAGQVLTGLGIGAVASGWHEKFDELSSKAKLNRLHAPTGTQA